MRFWRGRGGGRGHTYGISALLVLALYTAREPRRQQRSYGLGRLHRKQERGIPIGILAEPVVFMPRVYEEFLTAPPQHPFKRGAHE